MAHDDEKTGEPAASEHDSEPLANLGVEESDAAFEEFKHPNRKRLYMLGGFVGLVALSFVFGRWHDAWRAIVLDVRQDEMFLGYARRPPEWVDGRITEPGNIVVKVAWSWNAEPANVDVDDDALVALYQRYTKTYVGTLVEIRAPMKPGAFPLGVIRTDNGTREYVTLVDTVLLGAELNRRVQKTTGTWDPKLLPKDNAAVQFMPPSLPDPNVPPAPDDTTPPAP
jgi:hypothetical protein